MTQILAAHIGNYPRIGDHKDQQRHRRGLTHYLKKDISAHAFRDVVQSVAQETIHEQTELGLDEVTDGLISWPDPISAIAAKWTGLTAGALRQYFDTSFHYRMVDIIGKPRRRETLSWEDFRFAKGISSKPVRAVLTGPVTLAVHSGSALKSFSKEESRISFFCDLLEQEIATLIKEGAQIIQIDEPSLLFYPKFKSLTPKIYGRLKAQAKSATLIVSTTVLPENPTFDPLFALPVDGQQVNAAVDDKSLLAKLEAFRPFKNIGLGLINGQSTRADLLDPILNHLVPWIEKNKPAKIYITTSTGLEFLPRDSAQAKLRAVVRLKQDLLKKFPPEPARA